MLISRILVRADLMLRFAAIAWTLYRQSCHELNFWSSLMLTGQVLRCSTATSPTLERNNVIAHRRRPQLSAELRHASLEQLPQPCNQCQDLDGKWPIANNIDALDGDIRGLLRLLEWRERGQLWASSDGALSHSWALREPCLCPLDCIGSASCGQSPMSMRQENKNLPQLQ